jgi:hypothetical protein
MTSKLDVRAEVGFDIDSTHARAVYWPGKNNISLEHNIKFYRRSTIVVRSPPPSPYFSHHACCCGNCPAYSGIFQREKVRWTAIRLTTPSLQDSM